MTWSMFSIGWLRAGDTSRGQQLFDRNFEYIHPDFQVLVGKTLSITLEMFYDFVCAVAHVHRGFVTPCLMLSTGMEREAT